MFTGIIEEIGKIKNIDNSEDFVRMSIIADEVLEDAKIGDSISINGTCLTVTSIDSSLFTVDIVKETLDKTNLKYLEKGNIVNLERAMKASGRFDGHIVQGHIEDVAEILSIKNNNDHCIVTLALPKRLAKYCIYKGSIALNGVSLTIATIDKNIIDIWLIPHTLKHTTFKDNQIGDYINVETDIVGKYIENFQKSES